MSLMIHRHHLLSSGWKGYTWVAPTITTQSNSGWADYYVDSSKADDTGDGLTLATAKKTLMAAKALATVTDKKIYVVSGTYNEAAVANGLANTTNSRNLSWFFENGCDVTLDGVGTMALTGTGTLTIYGYGIFRHVNAGATGCWRANGAGQLIVQGKYFTTDTTSVPVWSSNAAAAYISLKFTEDIVLTSTIYANAFMYTRGGDFHFRDITDNKASGSVALVSGSGALLSDLNLTFRNASVRSVTAGTIGQSTAASALKMTIRGQTITPFSSETNAYLFRNTGTAGSEHHLKLTGLDVKGDPNGTLGIVRLDGSAAAVTPVEIDNCRIRRKSASTQPIFQRSTTTVTPSLTFTGLCTLSDFTNPTDFSITGTYDTYAGTW